MPTEMTPPPRRVPEDDKGYFEILTKSVFQTGFRFSIVERKWPAFRSAFADFDLATVAAYGPPDVDRLLADEGIVRNARKIEATIENASVARDLVRIHGSLKGWLTSTADLPWPERKRAVAAPFKQLGPFAAYLFLYCVGEAVPPHELEPTWTEPVPPGSPESLEAAKTAK